MSMQDLALRVLEAASGAGGFPASHVVIFPYFLVIGYSAMLAKKTVKNQITLPKKIADRFPRVEYFDVRAEDVLRVLAYPKFRLTQDDIQTLLGTYLPFTEAVNTASAKTSRLPRCRDPHDLRFLDVLAFAVLKIG